MPCCCSSVSSDSTESYKIVPDFQLSKDGKKDKIDLKGAHVVFGTLIMQKPCWTSARRLQISRRGAVATNTLAVAILTAAALRAVRVAQEIGSKSVVTMA